MRTEKKSRHAFGFVPKNSRPEKPRKIGKTEIRGPYYTVMGSRYLRDILDTVGEYVDSLKYSGGSFRLMERRVVKELNSLAHEYNVEVSTGGFVERVLSHGPDLVPKYIEECKSLEFDIVEISTGFISLPTDDWLRLIEDVQKAKMKAKPEIGIQFGAGGDTPTDELAREGRQDLDYAIKQGLRFLGAGADIIMMESEGVTENVSSWNTEVPATFINELGIENVMFEAAEPKVFEWYIKNYGADVNLFVDHSQIVQLEALRSGLWGTKDSWGRVLTYKSSDSVVGGQ